VALANAGNLPLLGFGLWGVSTASIALDAVPAGRRASVLYADRGRHTTKARGRPTPDLSTAFAGTRGHPQRCSM
jgi:hypothetical protein